MSPRRLVDRRLSLSFRLEASLKSEIKNRKCPLGLQHFCHPADIPKSGTIGVSPNESPRTWADMTAELALLEYSRSPKLLMQRMRPHLSFLLSSASRPRQEAGVSDALTEGYGRLRKVTEAYF